MGNPFKFMSIITVIAITAGCAGLPKGNGRPSCVEMKNNLAITDYETIKKIVIEEAQNNGVADTDTFSAPKSIKPSKYNNWQGEIVYTSFDRPPKLAVRFDKNKICFEEYNSITEASGPINAIATIQDRLQDVKGNKKYFANKK